MKINYLFIFGLFFCSSHLIAGEKDTNAPAPMMEKMASKIPGATYICMAGTGHLSNMEKPEKFDLILKNFIQKIR